MKAQILTKTAHQLIIRMVDFYEGKLTPVLQLFFFPPFCVSPFISHCTDERKDVGYKLCWHKTKAENTMKITFSMYTGNCTDTFAVLES